MSKDANKTVEECLSVLLRKGVKVDQETKQIYKGNYGIGTWATIDCLTNYHGYSLRN